MFEYNREEKEKPNGTYYGRRKEYQPLLRIRWEERRDCGRNQENEICWTKLR